jgi:hypothetical protein
MTAPASAPIGAPPTPVRLPNTAGNVGFVLAIVLLAVSALGGLLATLLPSFIYATHLPASSFGAIIAVPNILGLLLGIAAVVLGIVGVTRRGLPHGRAGAAVAVGAFVVVSSVVGDIAVVAIPAAVLR